MSPDLNTQGTGTDNNPGAPTNQLSLAQSATLASARQQCAALNNVLIADYKTKHDNWAISEMAHPGTVPEPQPPMAWIVSSFTDPTTGPGSNGVYGDEPIHWATVVRSTHPVCAPLPPPQMNIKPTAPTELGGLMGQMVRDGGGTVEASLFNKSVALYAQVTAPDGSIFLRVQ